MDIELKKVENESQIDDLCRVAERVWHLTYDDLLPEGQVDYMVEKFQSSPAIKKQMAQQNYRYYSVFCDGENAGFVGFSPRYEGREEMFLSKVYLLPEYRGHGAVRKMFDLVEEETKKEGLKVIRLTVNKENSHAVDVYTHYGFVTEELAVTDIGNGYVMDDFIMFKRL